MNRDTGMKIITIGLTLVLCVTAGCTRRYESNVSRQTPLPVETQTPATPEPTPVPTPEITPDPLSLMPVQVNGDGTFELYGKMFSVQDTYLNLAQTYIDDNGELLEQVIPCLPSLQAVDLDSCGLSDERCARLRDEFPNVEIIWRIYFAGYTVRTNVTKILASAPGLGDNLKAGNTEALKYCTKVRYLDIGHNEILTDLSFIRYMPDLEICVISMTKPGSLDVFTSCPNLVYLEAGNCGLTDCSPLAECKKLKHLNLGTNIGITDITCLYDLDLLRLWLGNPESTSVPQEQMDEYAALHPQCEVNNTVTPYGEAYTVEDWKYFQHTYDYATHVAMFGQEPTARPLGYYKVVYKAFQYYKGGAAYALAWADPKYTDPQADPVNTYVLDISQLSEKYEYPDYDNPDNLIPDELDTPPGEVIYQSPY